MTLPGGVRITHAQYRALQREHPQDTDVQLEARVMEQYREQQGAPKKEK